MESSFSYFWYLIEIGNIIAYHIQVMFLVIIGWCLLKISKKGLLLFYLIGLFFFLTSRTCRFFNIEGVKWTNTWGYKQPLETENEYIWFLYLYAENIGLAICFFCIFYFFVNTKMGAFVNRVVNKNGDGL